MVAELEMKNCRGGLVYTCGELRVVLRLTSRLTRTPQSHDSVGARTRHDGQLGVRRDVRDALV